MVLGTLVLQGLTLAAPRALDLHDDDPVGREVSLARTRALRAAMESFDDDRSPAAASVRDEFSARLASASDDRRGQAPRTPHDRIRRQAVAAARRAVLEMRTNDDIGDDAFHVVEEELDWVEMSGTTGEQVD